jgi:hypothetical protein
MMAERTNFEFVAYYVLAKTSLAAGQDFAFQEDVESYALNKKTYLGVDINQSFNAFSIHSVGATCQVSVELDPGNVIDVTKKVDGVTQYGSGAFTHVESGFFKRMRVVGFSGDADLYIQLFNK